MSVKDAGRAGLKTLESCDATPQRSQGSMTRHSHRTFLILLGSALIVATSAIACRQKADDDPGHTKNKPTEPDEPTVVSFPTSDCGRGRPENTRIVRCDPATEPRIDDKTFAPHIPHSSRLGTDRGNFSDRLPAEG